MIDFTEIADGESWELFARDFLSATGFVIDSPPDRGADRGKDILASEDLTGRLANYRFRWLVSCKHNAMAGRAVTETDEPNIIERVESFSADGFIGFYSTVPSAGLNDRLRALRQTGKLRDYRVFDHKLIENYLIRVGYSHLLLRYFPQSYRLIRPLHQIADEYVPLSCSVCEKDLLEALYREQYEGIVGFAKRIRRDDELDTPSRVESVFWVCKGSCDRKMEERLRNRGMYSGWEDISDLVIPSFYLHFVFSLMNSIREGTKEFSDQAYEDIKTFVFALSQKVLREVTGEEQKRVGRLLALSSIRS